MDDVANSTDEMRGFAVMAQTCAGALLNRPSEQVVDELAGVARTLGDDRFEGIEPDDALRQRYDDRLFVPTSPYYVPLCESSVRGALENEGRVTYASVVGPQADHVLLCYRSVGFDFRNLAGFEPAVNSLRPDSMASELMFLASLARAAADEDAHGPAASKRAAQLVRQFAREHASTWFGKAARCLRRSDDDFYARLCALAAQAVESMAEAEVCQ